MMNSILNFLDFLISIIKFIIIVHFANCLWIIISMSNNEFSWYQVFILSSKQSWIEENELYNEDNENFIYLEGLNYIISTVTTIGFGTTYAISNAERAFVLILMVASVVVYSFIIGRISNYVNEVNSESKEKDEKIKHLNAIIKKFDIKNSLIKKIKYHFSQKNNNLDVNNKIKLLTDKLPEKLRYDINEKIMDKRLEKLMFFNRKNIAMIIYVSKYLYVVNYNQDDYICKINQVLKESKIII